MTRFTVSRAETRAALFGFAGVGAGCAAYGLLHWTASSDWIEAHSGLASWVQAVGAIVAIGAGFSLAARAEAKARHDAVIAEELKRRRTRRAAWTMATLATAQLVAMAARFPACRASNDVTLLINALGPHARWLAAFDIAALEEQQLIICFSNITGLVQNCIDDLSEALDPQTGANSEAIRAMVTENLTKLASAAASNMKVFSDCVGPISEHRSG